VNAIGAQSGLFDPPKPRSVSAPTARGWWGVDSALDHYVIGCVDVDLNRRSDCVMTGPGDPSKPATGERLHRMDTSLDELIVAMLEDGAPEPAVVWVEQASGQSPAPKLVMCVGVAARAVYGVLRRELGYPVHVELVPSATWKSKLAPGAGGWHKTAKVPGRKTPKPLATEEYKVLQWSRANGFTGDGETFVNSSGRTVSTVWDHSDARGIAEGARRTFAIENV
jgi:hypothetical protein